MEDRARLPLLPTLLVVAPAYLVSQSTCQGFCVTGLVAVHPREATNGSTTTSSTSATLSECAYSGIFCPEPLSPPGVLSEINLMDLGKCFYDVKLGSWLEYGGRFFHKLSGKCRQLTLPESSEGSEGTASDMGSLVDSTTEGGVGPEDPDRCHKCESIWCDGVECLDDEDGIQQVNSTLSLIPMPRRPLRLGSSLHCPGGRI